MKAKIIEHRVANLIERILHVARYVTVWQLEDGRTMKIYTMIEGGVWTNCDLRKKINKSSDKKTKEDRLKREVGVEVEINEREDC